MKTSRILLSSLCLAGTLLASVPAGAHAIWFAQRGRQTAMVYGVGADDLDAVKRLPLLTSVVGYDAEGQPVATSMRAAGIVPVVESEEPVTIVAAAMDYGLWSKAPDGAWHNKGRDEVPNATVSEHNFKYAVWLGAALQATVPVIPSQTMQIMPLGPIPAEKGKPLKLKVLLGGKPLAGATVITDYVNDPDEVAPKTAADGTLTINVRNQGLNVVTAIILVPSDQPKRYDRIEHRATLSFVLPHAPE